VREPGQAKEKQNEQKEFVFAHVMNLVNQ
jgi:hypothetical protein